MKILNFGSLNIDRVYRVGHFVRPGETLASESMERFPGGKGLNQSVALARAGARVYHAGCIGSDGEFLRALLEECGADTRYIRLLPDLPTGDAVIQVTPDGQNAILLQSGANGAVSPEMAERTLADFGAGDWLLLQNEISSLCDILRMAADRGMRIALNPSPITPKLLGLPLDRLSCLILNEVEGKALTGEDQPRRILSRLRRDLGIQTVVLTLGAEGSLYADVERTLFQPAFEVRAVDTTGAGDTFTGYFLAGTLEGLAPQTCLARAAAAAALAVTRPGAALAIPRAEEIGPAMAEFGRESRGGTDHANR